jgi:CheY-like chemotaxis protein
MQGNVLKGKKILIVEDDFSSKFYLNKILEHNEAILLNSSDGKDAFEIVKNNPDIDIILMDIQLPIIDGYTCTKMIRESGKKMVIIAQTAYGLDDDKDLMMSLGFNDYLIKPISQKQLIDKITFCLINNQAVSE